LILHHAPNLVPEPCLVTLSSRGKHDKRTVA
jgi:hypothetical protein